MSKALDQIEGIGPAYKEKMATAGITTVEALLEKGATTQGRKELSETTGMSESVILNWVNMADLFRINGVAGQFAELLQVSGVNTVKEFATRNAENLFTKLTEVNAEKNLTKVIPSVERLQSFIDEAKTLAPVVTH